MVAEALGRDDMAMIGKDETLGWDPALRNALINMGSCVCIWLIRFVVQQKLTRYCEAIILQ